MVEFAYNNTKNVSMGYMYFILHCRYHPDVLFKENVNLYSRFKTDNELTEELKNPIAIYRNNL